MAFNTVKASQLPPAGPRTLAELINQLPAGTNHPALIIVDDVLRVEESHALDARHTLRIERGGQLHFTDAANADVKLVASGEIEAGRNHIFVDLDNADIAGRVVSGTETATETVFPEWWGARADYVGPGTGIDNRFAIRAAIDFFSGLDEQTGGGEVRFSAGYYRLEGAIQLRDNVWLKGRAAPGARRRGTALYFERIVNGQWAAVKSDPVSFPLAYPVPAASPSAMRPLVVAVSPTSEPHYIRVEDMAFAPRGYTGGTMALQNCRAEFRNVSIRHSKEYALMIDSTVNSRFERVSAAGLVVEGSTTTTTFSACAFQGTPSSAVTVRGAARSLRFCDGTIIEDVGGHGVELISSDGVVTIDGCHFENIRRHYVKAGFERGQPAARGRAIVRGLDLRRCEFVGGVETEKSPKSNVVHLGNVRHAHVSIAHLSEGAFSRNKVLAWRSITGRLVYVAPWFVGTGVQSELVDTHRTLRIGEPASRVGPPTDDMWVGGYTGATSLKLHPASSPNGGPFAFFIGSEGGAQENIVTPSHYAVVNRKIGFLKMKTINTANRRIGNAWVPFFRSLPSERA